MKNNILHLMSRWDKNHKVKDNIVHFQHFPAKKAELTPFPENLSPILRYVLENQGIHSLYSHQEEAFQAALEGKNILVSSGTASGKTLCFNLPVFQKLIASNSATALYLYPTKALTQDQYLIMKDLSSGINSFCQDLEITIGVYDGDTPTNTRKEIRDHCRVILTNPDMLHVAVLPHHTQWASFFRNLQFVIIDEVHTYRGVFGSHVSNLLRRLKRICKFYGASVHFICTSATINNPKSFTETLIEEPIHLINQDGSARGGKYFIFYNPPIVNSLLGLRKNYFSECELLLDSLIDNKNQVILFARSRRSVEILFKNLKERYPSLFYKIYAYRGGYLPKTRRKIEKDLKDGVAQVVAATNALELGMDIGTVDGIIMAGYPGTISSTIQQSGRAGRKGNDSLAILVASPSPIDQYLMKHPEYFFEANPECAYLNPDNPIIYLQHLQCSIFELPLNQNEIFGNVSLEELQEGLEYLASNGSIFFTGSKYIWRGRNYPSQNVSLRNTDSQRYLLEVRTEGKTTTLGYVDYLSAAWMIHPGAIYLHEGDCYQVSELDTKALKAYLEPASGDYFTIPLKESTFELITKKQFEAKKWGGKFWGEIKIITQIKGFKEVLWDSFEVLAIHPLDMPKNELHTMAAGFSINSDIVSRLRENGNWTNDRVDYGREWEKLKEVIRERDHYQCQVCGIKEGKTNLHVHHIKPLRSFHSLEEANQQENLITLCPKCHQKVESVVRIKSGLSGLGYALKNVAPLFLMCDITDIEVYCDVTSPYFDGDPIVLLYEQIPMGIGLSVELYKKEKLLFDTCFDLVKNCPCDDGCPSCVGAGGELGLSSKKATLAILESITHGF